MLTSLLVTYTQAIVRFKQAQATNPDDTRTWYNLGEAYFKSGQYADAVETFEHIRKFNTQLPQMNLRIASCYEKLDNHYKAKEALEEIITMKRAANVPENIRGLARDYLAQIQLKSKDGVVVAAAAAA